ncbi:MAG TPA: HlyD family efflux transporter periplasmic adaptor subunit [Anaerolineaceae bacterium]|nr:HlyD family efflux transporter periplasmic adaptor subunit [Anaerolineaceae bacterium]
MKRKLFFLVIGAGLIILLSGCDSFRPIEATPVIYESSTVVNPGMIIADGEVVPVNDMQIITHTSGKIEEILVEEGQVVEEGQLIIRMETPQALLAELQASKLDQLIAQQSLDDFNLNGPLQKHNAYQRVLNAKTAVRAAKAAWDDFDKNQYEDDLEAIKEDVIDAKKDLDDAKEELKKYLDLEKDNPQRKNRQDDVDDAQLKLSELEREQEELEQSYEQLQLSIEIAEAEEESASAEYQKFGRNFVPGDRVKLMEEQLTTAKSKIEAIEKTINDLEITVPIDGTMLILKVQKGEWVYAGQVIAVVADFSSWYVESTDITELEIVDISIGDMVTLEFDAFPEKVLKGKVIEISDQPEIRYNDVLYRVRIELPDHDLPLRWKMSTIIKLEK